MVGIAETVLVACIGACGGIAAALGAVELKARKDGRSSRDAGAASVQVAQIEAKASLEALVNERIDKLMTGFEKRIAELEKQVRELESSNAREAAGRRLAEAMAETAQIRADDLAKELAHVKAELEAEKAECRRLTAENDTFRNRLRALESRAAEAEGRVLELRPLPAEIA